MNHKMVFNMLGRIIILEAALMVLPLVVSLCYGEKCTLAFALTILIALAVGFLMWGIFRTKNHVIYAKEGFVIVALSWIAMSAIGALPFVISGDIPSYTDAFFETVSGFTTTGASILNNVEALDRGILFWRSFTHWVGGMGVLVFIVALLPSISDRSIHILRAEMPGPIMGKLVPKIKDTAKILYLIYIVLTVIEVIMLLCGGMPLYDSVVHAFGTAGTGGFGIKQSSIAGYSPYLQWVIAIFMFLFAVNFNLYYLLLIKKFKTVVKSVELWVFIGISVISSVIITADIFPMFESVSDAFRAAVFQVGSLISTTGYTTADFNQWPELSKAILLLLMLIGGCAGSTAGGLKVSRIILIFKMVRRELRHLLHPRSVGVVKFEGKRVSDETLNSVGVYFLLYVLCFGAVFLLLCFEPFDFETNFSATLACFNNVGPGFGLVGPASSYADYSGFSKIILSFAMLMGRLEIFPLILAFSPSTWTRK
ncbi:MAG: TrkH family potassium uptake protein [Clostridiales bacterium]|nr:TrkH family potassium uptake protein [Clostridiales bacterium]